MIRRPPRSTQSRSSAASDVYKRQPKMIERSTSRTSIERTGAKRHINKREHNIQYHITTHHHYPKACPAHGDQRMIIIGGVKKRQALTFNIGRTVLIDQLLVFDHRLRPEAKVILG